MPQTLAAHHCYPPKSSVCPSAWQAPASEVQTQQVSPRGRLKHNLSATWTRETGASDRPGRLHPGVRSPGHSQLFLLRDVGRAGDHRGCSSSARESFACAHVHRHTHVHMQHACGYVSTCRVVHICMCAWVHVCYMCRSQAGPGWAGGGGGEPTVLCYAGDPDLGEQTSWLPGHNV